MNMLSPDQMPASPQSNTSDSQISGRKPASALTTVAVRMNARVAGAEQDAVNRENDSCQR